MNTATTIAIAALAALTPTVTTMIGIIYMRNDTRELRAEMNALGISLRSEMSSLRAEMNALRSEMHRDMLAFQASVAGEMASIRERMAVVEAGR